MKPVEEIQNVGSGLWFWQGYDPAVKVDLSSCALSGPGVIIDPVPLADSALAELAAAMTPRAVVLTNGNHERAARQFAARFGVKVFAPEGARGEAEADEWFADGSAVCGLRAIALPGAPAGETALFDAAGQVMIVGDAIINLDPNCPALLPDKYCDDAKRMRTSLPLLLGFHFEKLAFAHGAPIVEKAHARLAALLAS